MAVADARSEGPREDSPFWRFSLRFYGRPQVAAACISLQDGAGADVNLMLFLLYLAEHKREVDEAGIGRLDGTVHAWRERVVKPLRELRRVLKPGIGEIPIAVSENFRASIKRLELDSERIEQHALEGLDGAALGRPAPSRMAAAEANLAAYSAHLGGMPAEPRAAILTAFAAFERQHP